MCTHKHVHVRAARHHSPSPTRLPFDLAIEELMPGTRASLDVPVHQQALKIFSITLDELNRL